MLNADRQTGDLAGEVSVTEGVVMSTKQFPPEDTNGPAKTDGSAAECLDGPFTDNGA
jgi:hypothetical protein